MAAREKPLEKEMAYFVRAHLGKGVFAPFTGTDYAAWKAWCHLIALYGTAQARTFHIPREAPLYANAVHADLHRQRAFAAMASKAVS